MKLKHLLPAVTSALLLTACGSGANKNGVALEGTLATDSIQDFVLSYAADGDIQNYRYINITRDEKGHFEIADSLIPAGGVHATLMADDHGFFGVWIEPGKTAVAEISGTPSTGLKVSYSGDNADVNELFNDITTTYDIMVYTPQDPSEAMTKDEAMARLNKDRERINAKVATLSDADKRDYYAKYAELLSDRMEGFVIEDNAYASDAEPLDDPDYQALIAKVDPNLDQALETGMIYVWLHNATRGMDATSVEGNVAQLKLIDEKITNPRTRKALYHNVPNSFFAYYKPTPEAAAEFMKAYGEMAKDYPEFIDHYTMVAQGVKEIKTGDKVSYDPTLQTVDGKTCKLSDLYGKLLYVDFWATWCGPCCKQIPHLEKLVEKMKDVKGVEFVSISCDTDVDAWKAKVAKDNPQWPQYIFAPGEGDKFMGAMNITGIPRFMLFAPDGSILMPEAPMPSDAKIEQTLKDYLK